MPSFKKKFLDWEEENNLFSFKYNGFPVWAFVRLGLYMAASRKDFEFEQFKRESSILSPKLCIKEKVKLVWNCIKFLVNFRKLKKAEILVVSRTSNRVLKGEHYYDKFFDQIKLKEKKIALLEFPSLDAEAIHYKANFNPNRVVFGEFLYICEVINRKFFNNHYDDSDSIFALYKSFIKENLDYEISPEVFHQHVSKQINRQINRLHIFRKLIEFTNPKALVLKSSYDPMSQMLNFYSNRVGGKTIEFQHGHIYSEHPGYFRSKNIDPDVQNTYPEKIFVENEFYRNILLDNYWHEDSINVVGEIIQKKSVDATALTSRIPQNATVVTVINQHTLSEEIADLLLAAKLMPDYIFLIKLHPRLIHQQIDAFRKVLMFDNVVLVKNEYSIEECFSVSNSAVGVYSTGLIDALKRNIPVNILNLPGCEFMDDLVGAGLMSKIDRLQDINSQFILNNNTLFSTKDNNLINQTLYNVVTE